MPSSFSRDLLGVRRWPNTPPERKIIASFSTTGLTVIDRIINQLSEGLPLPPSQMQESRLERGDHRTRFWGSLYPGSRFQGHQNAADQGKVYKVEVEIKDVNMQDSFLCGYLTIHDLTVEYPHLTTFFEAEIISSKHPFITQKWEANLDADKKHWEKFPYFLQHCSGYLNGGMKDSYDFLGHDMVFMRWKERFLVPDHHVENISGASYAGFYYIAYDIRSASIEGYYFHRESREFQKLELSHIPNKQFPAFEFR